MKQSRSHKDRRQRPFSNGCANLKINKVDDDVVLDVPTGPKEFSYAEFFGGLVIEDWVRVKGYLIEIFLLIILVSVVEVRWNMLTTFFSIAKAVWMGSGIGLRIPQSTTITLPQ